MKSEDRSKVVVAVCGLICNDDELNYMYEVLFPFF